jgi:hypothetical protein
VKRIIICTLNYDLGQCVCGRSFSWNCHQDELVDADGVIDGFGVTSDPILTGWLARRRQR